MSSLIVVTEKFKQYDCKCIWNTTHAQGHANFCYKKLAENFLLHTKRVGRLVNHPSAPVWVGQRVCKQTMLLPESGSYSRGNTERKRGWLFNPILASDATPPENPG